MASQERVVRRRSSKACDQCRKTKCKCQPSDVDADTCKNCLVLGTKCTYEGPSRKRGPAKGYLSELELKLHQCEALLGSILASNDQRAQSLVADLSRDPLAADILSRVDSSPFGPNGKHPLRILPEHIAGTSSSSSRRVKTQEVTFSSAAQEWQEPVTEHLETNISSPPDGHATGSHSRSASSHSAKSVPHGNVSNVLDFAGPAYQEDVKPQLLNVSSPQSSRMSSRHQSPRQRRRIDSSPHRRTQLWVSANSEPHSDRNSVYDVSSDDEVADELGQLSLNEDRQLRYHGKTSGLHLLCHSAKERQHNGIWNFPQAGVWPPLPAASAADEQEDLYFLPPAEMQEHLLSLYFTFVHPALPILDESRFMEAFRRASATDSPSPILLLAMFSVASRYSDQETPLPPKGHMWPAGDGYATQVRILLAKGGCASHLPTCQAILLLGYRDIGIGAMARAWMSIGMAVRMAQDLGLHRSLAKMQSNASSLFGPQEEETRNRTWYALVHMDRYVSSYIGRPLSISERDFDTPLPESNNSDLPTTTAMTGVALSCFKAAIGLSSIISEILSTLYAVRPTVPSRSAHLIVLEQRLERWYLDLEPCLRLEPANKAVIPSCVLTLHMQYWSSVLLVHRVGASNPSVASSPAAPEDPNFTSPRHKRAFDMSANAANRISSLVSVFMERYSMKCAPAFLTYYVFSSSITHVATLSVVPQDVQARMGLRQNMAALKAMEIVWPSAGRAWELLNGCGIIGVPNAPTAQLSERQARKRMADEILEASLSYSSNTVTPPNDFHHIAAAVFQAGGPRHTTTRNTHHHMRTHSHPNMSMSMPNNPVEQESRPQHSYQQSLPCSLSTFAFPPPRASPQSSPAITSPSVPKLWSGFSAPFSDPSTIPNYYGLIPSFQTLGSTTLEQEQFFGPDYASYGTQRPNGSSALF